jgi:hypothetical protein
MKTERLIAALAADKAPEQRPGRALLIALALGIATAGVVFALTLGPRPDFLHAIETWRFVFKFVVTLVLSASAFLIGWRMAYPMPSSTRRDLVLLIAPLLLIAAILVEMTSFPVHDWMPRLIGHNSRVCMSMIPVLSLAPLAAMLWALRKGAPLNPLRAGAIAGLIAGGIGAAWYASHCPDDSPLFIAVWYTIGISIVTVVGAALGSRLLRW